MDYNFNAEHAIKYGVDNAIMIRFFQFWITTNKANKRNEFDGRTWTYNSLDALVEMMPFWTKRQVERILKSLTEEDVLLKGNFNKFKLDRTVWYAFKNEADFIPLEKYQELAQSPKSSISPNGEMHITERGNVISPNGDNNNQLITNKEQKKSKKEIPSKRQPQEQLDNKTILSILPPFIDAETFLAYIELRRGMKLSNTQLVINRLIGTCEKQKENGNSVNEMLMKAITGGWKDLYLVETKTKKSKGSDLR